MTLPVERVPVAGSWWRHTPHGADPLWLASPPSSGRWQRGSAVAAIYLADEEQTAWAEWYRALAEIALPPTHGMPRDLWRWNVAVGDIADLSTPVKLAQFDLSLPAPGRLTWPPFQAVGEQLHREGYRGRALSERSATRASGAISLPRGSRRPRRRTCASARHPQGSACAADGHAHLTVLGRQLITDDEALPRRGLLGLRRTMGRRDGWVCPCFGGVGVLKVKRLGIASKNSRPYHPQTCGKVERLHQTLKRYLAKQAHAATIAELQGQLDAFCHYYNDIRPPRALAGRTPLQAYSARVKAKPASGPRPATHFCVRHDKVDRGGMVTLRHMSKLHHIGIGRAHKGRTIKLLIADRDIRIIDRQTGQLLRQLTLDPNRDYQPINQP